MNSLLSRYVGSSNDEGPRYVNMALSANDWTCLVSKQPCAGVSGILVSMRSGKQLIYHSQEAVVNQATKEQ